MNASRDSGTPARWGDALLGDLCDFIRGVTYKKIDALNKPSSGYIAILRAGNLQQGEVIWDDLVYLPEDYVHEAQRLNAGDIVVAMSSGSSFLVGKAATVQENRPDASFGAFCGLLRPRHPELAPWLSLFFQSELYLEAIRAQASGTSINNLRRSHFSSLRVPLPPLNEQRRIVSKIKMLRASSLRARSELESIPPLLEKLRQSALKSAFSGKMTAAWREQNPHSEPASKLLDRIRIERRRRWEEKELAEIITKGKSSSDEAWKEKYKQPVKVNAQHLPRIPAAWEWTSLDTIAHIRGGLAKGKKRTSGEPLRSVPYLRVANVQRGYLNLKEMHEIQASESEIENLRLQHGDILFNEGGDRDQLGRGWIWEAQIPECIHQNHVFRARLIGQSIPPALISQYANSFGQAYFFKQGRQTTNLASISLTTLASLPVPLMPTEEAQHLASSLEHTFSMLLFVKEQVEFSLQELTMLERISVKKAFHGDLVRQSSDDPPVEELLNRLQNSYMNKLREPKKAPKNIRTRAKQEKRMSSPPSPITQSHLRDTIQSTGNAMAPDALWRASHFSNDIDAFYAQLRREISAGLLREVRLDERNRVIEVLR